MRHALVLAFPTTASFANTEEFENVLSIIGEFTIFLHTLHSSLQENIPSYNMAYFFASFYSIFIMLVSEVSHLEESISTLKTNDPIG